MTVVIAQLERVGGRRGDVTKIADRAHGFERAGHHLGGAGAVQRIGHLGLEQLGMREDDAELVVQAVEEEARVLIGAHSPPRLLFGVEDRAMQN